MHKYSCKCIAPGCEESFEVMAASRMEAINKIVELGEGHIFDKHPEMPILSSEAKRKLIINNLEALSLALGFMITIVSMPPVV